MPTPYKIACLVYLFNAKGQLMLLHRKKAPNKDLYSPIGGKLEQHLGESPYMCALRETHEEVGLTVPLRDMRLMGMVAETAFPSANDQTHWLMFCFEVTVPVDLPEREFDEGRLEWVNPGDIDRLNIPKTDREVIWPLIAKHSQMLRAGGNTANKLQNGDAPPSDIFSVHIDCTNPDQFVVTHEHPKA